jgi:hypothetical protein
MESSEAFARWDAVWLSNPRLLTATATAAAVGFGAAWLICSLRQPQPRPRPHARRASEEGRGRGAANAEVTIPRSASLKNHTACSLAMGEPAAPLQAESTPADTRHPHWHSAALADVQMYAAAVTRKAHVSPQMRYVKVTATDVTGGGRLAAAVTARTASRCAVSGLHERFRRGHGPRPRTPASAHACMSAGACSPLCYSQMRYAHATAVFFVFHSPILHIPQVTIK